MKIRSTNRIYISQELSENKNLILDGDILHYIRNVLRLKSGDKLRVFNENSGEFLANISDINKKELHLQVENLLKKPYASHRLVVALCIIKNDKMADMISMLVQLGVTKIVPIISEYVVHRNFNRERFLRIAEEASEQCERLDVPSISEPILLQDFVKNCKSKIIYAYENSNMEQQLKNQDAVYMIGPEGGFSTKDVAILEKVGATPVSLGKNILRAETAAARLISNVQFLRGL